LADNNQVHQPAQSRLAVLGRVYRTAAAVLLNTLILLAVIELVSAVAIQLIDSTREGTQNAYAPYVGWRFKPLTSETVNIDRNGLRLTPGADCGPGSFRVHAYGASTMWGSGVSDQETIPAYLQTALAPLVDRPLCVVNYGQPAYVSTQSLIQLTLDLQAGNVPDLVIFYDGPNDVISAYQSGQPYAHHNLKQIAAKFEKGATPISLLTGSQTFALFRKVAWGKLPVGEFAGWHPPADEEIDALAGAVANTYAANYRLLDALAAEYGFHYVMFWQPVLLIDKPLAPEEEPLIREREVIMPGIAPLFEASYAEVRAVIPRHDRMHDLSTVFEATDTYLYTDTWHLLPEGNRIVGQAMVTIIEQDPALVAAMAGD
jgi:lysophospholipase L1-like esterase